MSGTNEGRPRPSKRRIDSAALGRFLAALRRGARLQDAAAEAGFSLAGFYRVRKRDPDFAAAWAEAMAFSAAPCFIAAGNRRRLQLRRVRRPLFTAERKQLFLDHFAGTCDVAAAARATGVCESTVYRHLHQDPDFARAFDRALATGYVRLETEALRQRLEAQRRFREGTAPIGEIAQEFERVLKLLTRWERRNGSLGPRSVSPGRLKSCTFDEAMELLERKLTALGYRLPGEDGGE